MYCRCAFAAIFIAVVAAPFCSAQNPIQTENANPGTSGWQLSNPAVNREIEGYASLTSVNIGGSINFSVSTSDSTFKIEIFRTGWYGGAGARLFSTVNKLGGGGPKTSHPHPPTGCGENKWASVHTPPHPPTL